MLRLAALYHNETGSLGDLAEALGLSNPALHMAIKRGQVSPDMAIGIESLLGRKLFPREMLRPDLFTLPQE